MDIPAIDPVTGRPTQDPRTGPLTGGPHAHECRHLGPGTMVYHPDPHVEARLHTETGGKILFVQDQGPTTGKAPIYDGRFNLEKHSELAQERLDH
jgi:hypothetical protein